MRPVVVVVSHTHWDREWYQPFEVFRARLCDTVAALLDLLDADPQFTHFMLDGQTICIDDVLALRPSLRARLEAHIASGRIGAGPWYVLQDEFLVGGESIVRNLMEGLRRAGDRAMRIGYLPDAFGHIAQMPRILRGFHIDTAVVWRGAGDAAPELRWRSLSGDDVLCLFLPGGYGNAHALGDDSDARLRTDLDTRLPRSRAKVLLWMNGNDHQPADANVPATLAKLRQSFQADIDIEHASLQRAVDLVRERVDVASLPLINGELRTATPVVPVLSGTWSSRSWQKARHDRAEALLVRFAEPLCAFGMARNEELARAWRMLLQCQPHDSICGCSIDDVHRDIDARLARVEQLGGEIIERAIASQCHARSSDFALHHAIAVMNPHPFVVSAFAEVSVQRAIADGSFRLIGPTGEASYEILSRVPADGPDRRPAEWLRLRVFLRELQPLGVRTLALEAGDPAPWTSASTIDVHEVRGGLALVERSTAETITHTFESQGDRGDLYDFSPRGNVRSSRDTKLGITVHVRTIDRRVELEVEMKPKPDQRVRARLQTTAPSFFTDTPFGWLERTTLGTHPVSSTVMTSKIAFAGLGLHEVERDGDALCLTLARSVGWLSRGDLSTRSGHAGYHVQTPEAQGVGTLRFRYVVAFGGERQLAAGVIAPYAIALDEAEPTDYSLLSIEPASVRLSIVKRAEDGNGLVVRLMGPPREAINAGVRFTDVIARACLSDLDERIGTPIVVLDNALSVTIPPDDVVTLRVYMRSPST